MKAQEQLGQVSDPLSVYLADRPNLKRYQEAMDSSMQDKINCVLPHLLEYASLPRPIFLSVGSGTGKLEKAIAELIPNCRVVCLDASLPMLESLIATSALGQLDERRSHASNNPSDRLRLVQSEAQVMPFGSESIDAVIASSLVHEIASYKDGMTFGRNTAEFYQNVSRVLKPGGKYILKDFIQPADPNEVVYVEVGRALDSLDVDPLEFIEKFAEQFEGDNLDDVRNQINTLKRQNIWLSGARLNMNAALALEVVTHYSWARSFEQEIKEKYAYLSLDSYAQYILGQFQQVGHQAVIKHKRSYLLTGYPEHILGRLNLYRPSGETYSLPDFTGNIVVQKIHSTH